MGTVEFFVVGRAAPQGSKRHIDQVPADESRGYSDIVTVTAPIAWAIVSEGVVR